MFRHAAFKTDGLPAAYSRWPSGFDGGELGFVDSSEPLSTSCLRCSGGGAPIYVYAGEPDLRAYVAANAEHGISVDHPTKPGATVDENPHHFVVVQVDGDRLSLEVISTGPIPYAPYNGSATLVLSDGAR